MDVLAFATLPVGGCFFVGTTLTAHAFEAHRLRKVGRLHAEYLDGSGRVLVPEGTLVRALPAREVVTAV